MNGMKSRPPEAAPNQMVPQISGKLIIIGVLTVSITAAAASWWFRYNATHRAAEFWGPKAARLIRDAPQVELIKLAPSTEGDAPEKTIELHGEKYKIATRVDASAAHGMTHLRNALIEDRSFGAFGAAYEAPPPHYWRWALEFRDGDESATVLFPEDCGRATLQHGNGGIASCEPIAKGLREMFAELLLNDSKPR